jgi:hypothetical protein
VNSKNFPACLDVLLGDFENLWLAGEKDSPLWQSFCMPIHDLINDESTKCRRWRAVSQQLTSKSSENILTAISQ